MKRTRWILIAIAAILIATPIVGMSMRGLGSEESALLAEEKGNTDSQKTVVVTGYMATPDKAWAIHKLNHKTPTEKYMMKVTRNYKIYFKKFANGEMGV